MRQINLGDESTIFLANKSNTNVAISDLINNFYSNFDEKLRFDLQSEHEVSKFFGKKVKGNKEGVCFLYWKNNGEFKGNFKNNLADGYGIRNFSNGEVFKGEFVKEVAQGFGIYNNSNGTQFTGYIDDNSQNGYGII
jgi:hypothetical protein